VHPAFSCFSRIIGIIHGLSRVYKRAVSSVSAVRVQADSQRRARRYVTRRGSPHLTVEVRVTLLSRSSLERVVCAGGMGCVRVSSLPARRASGGAVTETRAALSA